MDASQSPPAPNTINQLRLQALPPMAMLAGMQLEVFTPLQHGAMTADALAGALGTDPTKLSPLLFALVAAGLLDMKDGMFANTAEGDHYLVKGRPSYLGGTHKLLTTVWGAILQTAETIRRGEPQAKLDFDAMDESALRAFLRGVHAGTLADGRAIAKTADFTQVRHLLDVAGGSGGVAIGICETCPALQATVVDLPKTVAIAREFVEEVGLAGHISMQANDLVQGPPNGRYDVAVMRAFLQVLSRDQCQTVLTHVSQALEPGGLLHIRGYVLDDSRISPPETVTYNLAFLNVYDHGQAYTEQEHRDWLTQADFTDITRDILPGGTSAITARKR